MTAAGAVLVADGIAVACPSGALEVSDWARFHEEEKRRADAAEGRAEQLEREKVEAHREAQYWKARWGRTPNALKAVWAKAKDLRRVSGDALHLRPQVNRLEALLADIGVDTRERSTIASLRTDAGPGRRPGAKRCAGSCRRSRASVTICARRLRPCRARSSVARANDAARRGRTTRRRPASAATGPAARPTGVRRAPNWPARKRFSTRRPRRCTARAAMRPGGQRIAHID